MLEKVLSRSGETIGEGCLVARLPRSATVDSLTKSRLLCLQREPNSRSPDPAHPAAGGPR